jgi:hypothetical protein
VKYMMIPQSALVKVLPRLLIIIGAATLLYSAIELRDDYAKTKAAIGDLRELLEGQTGYSSLAASGEVSMDQGDSAKLTPRAMEGTKEGDDALAKSIQDLMARLELLERRLVETSETGAEGDNAEDPDALRDRLESKARAKEERLSQEPPRSAVVASDHGEQKGQSEWGKETEVNLRNSLADISFFTSSGGDVSFDCRQTICKVEWAAPEGLDLSSLQDEELLSMAPFELMRFASSNLPDGGQFYTSGLQDPDTKQVRYQLFIEQ